MSSIYENAQVTIAARTARNCDDGLRRLVSDRFRTILIPSSGLFVREFSREFGFSRESTELRPLMSRAWVFQEQHLSPRTLSFSEYETVWQCRRFCHTEAGITLLHSRFLQVEPEDPKGAWHEVVQAYSRLQITYESDRLPALAALAAKMSGFRKDDTYLAGLWQSTLLHDLPWRNAGFPLKNRCKASAPSWSWASIQGGVEFCFEGESQLLPSLQLVDILYVPVGPPHMGKSAESTLMIKGRVGRIGRQESTSYMHRFKLHVSANAGAPTSALQVSVWPDFESTESAMGAATENNETLIVLFMTSEIEPENLFKQFSGLLLRKASDAPVYERVGWLHVTYRGKESQWETDDPSFSPAELFISSETCVDKYMSTLPLESVTIV